VPVGHAPGLAKSIWLFMRLTLRPALNVYGDAACQFETACPVFSKVSEAACGRDRCRWRNARLSGSRRKTLEQVARTLKQTENRPWSGAARLIPFDPEMPRAGTREQVSRRNFPHWPQKERAERSHITEFPAQSEQGCRLPLAGSWRKKNGRKKGLTPTYLITKGRQLMSQGACHPGVIPQVIQQVFPQGGMVAVSLDAALEGTEASSNALMRGSFFVAEGSRR